MIKTKTKNRYLSRSTPILSPKINKLKMKRMLEKMKMKINDRKNRGSRSKKRLQHSSAPAGESQIFPFLIIVIPWKKIKLFKKMLNLRRLCISDICSKHWFSDIYRVFFPLLSEYSVSLLWFLELQSLIFQRHRRL